MVFLEVLEYLGDKKVKSLPNNSKTSKNLSYTLFIPELIHFFQHA